MKQLTSSTTAISIVIATVLFAVASYFDSPPPPLFDPDVNAEWIPDVRPDTAVRDEQSTQSCQKAEDRLLAAVDAAQACEVDDDCTLLDYGYPIQCMTSIAQDAVTAVRLEFREYENSCPYRVYYDCPSEPMQRVPVCRNNRCEVELQRHEQLKRLTLDYINRGGRAEP
jgi:hypothetical protein